MNFKPKALALVLCCLILAVSLAACNSKTGSNSGNTSQNSNSSEKTTVSPAFEMYKKITIGMTKDQVNAALGTTPVAETNSQAVPGTFNYKDKEGNYGVTVIFNDKNLLYSKTVIYGSAKILAPMTPKPVTQEQGKSIKKDMTSSEVISILGGDGVECSATAMLNDITKVGVIKRWGNSDGSFIQVVFTPDGKVGNSMFFSAR